jgi:hypothetical protein
MVEKEDDPARAADVLFEVWLLIKELFLLLLLLLFVRLEDLLRL